MQDDASDRLHISYGFIAEKSWRKRLFSLFRKSRHDIAILPRDAVALPLVDSIPLDGGAGRTKQFRHFRPIAKRLDQVSVALRHDDTIGIIFRVVNEDHSHDLKIVPSHTGDMPNEKEPYAVECGDRLRRTREALGFNKLRRFAESMGVDESRYSKWETGGAMVPPWFVRRLRDAHDVTFDWIYGGDDRRLPHDLVTNLRRQD